MLASYPGQDSTVGEVKEKITWLTFTTSQFMSCPLASLARSPARQFTALPLTLYYTVCGYVLCAASARFIMTSSTRPACIQLLIPEISGGVELSSVVYAIKHRLSGFHRTRTVPDGQSSGWTKLHVFSVSYYINAWNTLMQDPHYFTVTFYCVSVPKALSIMIYIQNVLR